MYQSLTGAFGGPAGYLRLPGNPEVDKEQLKLQLKLLPELKRILRTELKYLFSLCPEATQIAAERGIDMYKDDEETLPEELKQFWALFRAGHQLLKYIKHLEACKAQRGRLSSFTHFFKKAY